MKLNNKKVKKILLPILLGVTLIFAGFKYQANKINDLQQQLDSKTLHVEQSETVMYKDTIRNKFNELQAYKIEDGKINFKHSYKYKKDGFIDKKIQITAFADVYYEYDINLKDASIIEDDSTITVLIPKAYLNKESLHVEQDSIQLINSSTYSSWFADKEDNRIAMNEFTQSFEKEAAKRIDKYYKEEVKNHMTYQAKVQVKKLVGSFVHEKKIIVEVK